MVIQHSPNSHRGRLVDNAVSFIVECTDRVRGLWTAGRFLQILPVERDKPPQFGALGVSKSNPRGASRVGVDIAPQSTPGTGVSRRQPLRPVNHAERSDVEFGTVEGGRSAAVLGRRIFEPAVALGARWLHIRGYDFGRSRFNHPSQPQLARPIR